MSANEYYNGAAPPLHRTRTRLLQTSPSFTTKRRNTSLITTYLRMYGGQVAQAAMWGFGATLGADVANAAFGEAKVGGWVHVGRQTGRRRRTYKVHVSDFWICGLGGIFAEP